MKNIINIVKTTFALALLCLSATSFGQDKVNTPAAYELMKSKSLWMKSHNTAGLLLDNPIDFTEIGLSHHSYSGDFHRPQEGESGNAQRFNAEGAVFVGKVFAWGKFNYDRETVKDANFNASILDPFRDMPYMLADANVSEWRKQIYDMSFRVVTPVLSEKWHLGLQVDYLAASGAKQRDPRSENYFYTIRLKPGVVYSINNHHHIGVHVDYFNLKEDSRMSVVSLYDDQEYYVMYGLGTSLRRVGKARSTDYDGNSVGGGIQYQYKGAVNLLFAADYAYKVEDVKIGFGDNREDASLKDKVRHASLLAYTSTDRLTHYLTLDYAQKDMDGIESITEYDNTVGQNGYVTLFRDIRSTYSTRTALLDYDVTVDRGQEYDWKFGLGVKYTDKEDVYLLPRSEKYAENLAFQARMKKNVVLPGNSWMRRLLIGADYVYNNNLSGHYDYNGSHPEYVVVQEFEKTDTEYLNTSYWSAGITAVYSQKIKENKPANLFAKAAYRYTGAAGSLFGDRQLWQVSVGFNF